MNIELFKPGTIVSIDQSFKNIIIFDSPKFVPEPTPVKIVGRLNLHEIGLCLASAAVDGQGQVLIPHATRRGWLRSVFVLGCTTMKLHPGSLLVVKIDEIVAIWDRQQTKWVFQRYACFGDLLFCLGVCIHVVKLNKLNR